MVKRGATICATNWLFRENYEIFSCCKLIPESIIKSRFLYYAANWYVDEAKNMPLCGNSSGAG